MRTRKKRDWSKCNANDWIQADDLTPPCLYFIPDGQGWFRLIRGQVLVSMDLRTTFITAHVVVPSNGYSARNIRGLFNKSAEEHGFLVEDIIWKMVFGEVLTW